MATVTMAFLIVAIFTVGILDKTSASDQGEIKNPVVLLTGGFIEPIGPMPSSSAEVFSLDGSCNKDLPDISDHRYLHTTQFFKDEVIMCGGLNGINARKSSIVNYTHIDTCLTLDRDNKFVYHSQLALDYDYGDHGAIVFGDTFLLLGHEKWNGSHWVKGEQQTWNGSLWVKESYGTLFSEMMDQNIIHCLAVSNEGTAIIITIHHNPTKKGVYKYKNGVLEKIEDYPGPLRIPDGCSFIPTSEGESFLMAGGLDIKDGHSHLLSSYLYNVEKKEWEEVGNLAKTAHGGKILVMDGRVIMLLRGRDVDSTVVQEFNVENKTWAIIEQRIKRARLLYDATVVPGALLGC